MKEGQAEARPRAAGIRKAEPRPRRRRSDEQPPPALRGLGLLSALVVLIVIIRYLLG